MSDVNQPQPYDPTQVPGAQQPSSSRGCLYGCLFVLAAGVGLMLCAGIGGFLIIRGQVEKYTSAMAADLPTVEYTPEQFEQLEARVEAFTELLESGETPEADLELSAEELNALLTRDEQMRGRVFVRIEDGHVTGDVSIPTDGIPGGNGRFFNGSASLDVSMDEGVLIVTLADAELNGEKLPQEFVDVMANENLAKEAYKNVESAKMLRKFENIAVEGDKIVLKLRRPESTEDDPVSDSTDL